MAVGTLFSRGTGFLRTLVLVYAVGIGPLGNAYNNANTLPNTVYYLMLGGIFTSVVVPLLVRAARRDPDRGEAYAQRIFTLGLLRERRIGDGELARGSTFSDPHSPSPALRVPGKRTGSRKAKRWPVSTREERPAAGARPVHPCCGYPGSRRRG